MSIIFPPLPADLTEHKYDTGDVTLNYAVGPNNGPSLILIHGLGGMMHDFLNVYAIVKDHWQVTLIELRGHGKSSHSSSDYNFSSYHADIIGLLGDVVSGPSVVWGHSLGAITTMNIAANAPDLLFAAILEDPPMMIIDDPSHTPTIERFRNIQLLMRSESTDEQILAALTESQPGQSDSAYKIRVAAIKNNDPDIYTAPVGRRLNEKWDVDEILRQISVPVLLMQADPTTGGVVKDEHAERAMKLLSNARHMKYEGIGHGIHSALPEKTVADVEAFVSELVDDEK